MEILTSVVRIFVKKLDCKPSSHLKIRLKRALSGGKNDDNKRSGRKNRPDPFQYQVL